MATLYVDTCIRNYIKGSACRSTDSLWGTCIASSILYNTHVLNVIANVLPYRYMHKFEDSVGI